MTEPNLNPDAGLQELQFQLPIVSPTDSQTAGIYERMFALNQMPIVIIGLADRTLEEINRAFIDHFGFKFEQIKDSPIDEFVIDRGEEKKLSGLIQQMESGEIKTFSMECRIRTAEHQLVDTVIGADLLDKNRAVLTIQDITARLRREYKATQLANFDSLTNLPNRRLFTSELDRQVERAKQSEQRLGIMFLDLDGFKEINDNLGHEAGDQVLITVANRLRHTLRKGDYIARLGGDEFAIINNFSSRFNMNETAQRIIDSISNPIEVAGFPVTCRVSIGISTYPEDGIDGQQLLKHADIAMYEAKRKHKGFSSFGPEESQRIRMRLALRKELEHAIQLNSDELQVYFQPRICLKKGSIQTVEALARWNHPERGSILPSTFFPIAEETTLIHSLGRLVLHRVCEQIKAWQSKGIQLRVAVNLAAKELERSDILQQIESALNDYELDGRFLEIEIPETASMKDVRRSVRFMSRLKTLGVNLAIDDFGTGYSSLTYLKQLPADSIKIDQSFLHPLVEDVDFDSPDADIIRAIVTLADSFHMTTIAEGVETEQQFKFLKSLGCDFAQGYFFDAPVPAKVLEGILAKASE